MGSSYWYRLTPNDKMLAHLDELPVTARRASFERAIHRALDAEGWPRGERGMMSIPGSYWYVVVTRNGLVRGHVGPITDEQKARTAARSWCTTGQAADVMRTPIGPCLTNAY